MSIYRNGSGYADPTAGAAMANIIRDYKVEQRKIWRRQHELKSRPRVYIVSKFAGDTEANIRAAVLFCRYAIEKGKIPVASHLLYPQILDDDSPKEREMGLMFGLSLLAACKEVWVFGTEISDGMKQEIQEAKRLKKKIKYIKEVGA